MVQKKTNEGKEARYERGPGEEQVMERALYVEVIDETKVAIHPDEGNEDSSVDTAASNRKDNDVSARTGAFDDHEWIESIIVGLLQHIPIRGDKEYLCC